jgi:SHS2 domain-containing protein
MDDGMELIGSMDVNVIWQAISSEVGQITADFCHILTTNLTQHDSHGPDDQPKTIDYHRLDMSRDDGIDDGVELIGSMDVNVIWQAISSEVGQITADFCHTLTTNLTQHDSHGPDDQPKTIYYHHLDMSRDDGMGLIGSIVWM